jgi:phosphatidylserine decarboxylase
MSCQDREGNEIPSSKTQERVLTWLYYETIGVKVLQLLIHPFWSNLAGKVLDHSISKLLIPSFIEKNKIELNLYETKDYESFNDFFTRKVKAECRPIDLEPTHLIAPCDGKLSVYPITEDARFCVKNTWYTMQSLVRSKKLAKKFEGGQLLLFRLSVDDYHRYCYLDDGVKTKNYHIPGVFHTVNPIANDTYPIYKENTREFTLLKSDHFGDVLIMEVGALLVGRITNNHEDQLVTRGTEKGKFEYGGSTIIVCLEKNRAKIDEDLLSNSGLGIETAVKMGERIGTQE